MPKCPRCDTDVYFGERKRSLGKDWHQNCLRCANCNKLLSCGQHAEHDGEPFCHVPCYAKLYGPTGCRRSSIDSHCYKETKSH